MYQHLDKKTVLNIVYTQQATRMADAYQSLLDDFSQMTAWGRGLESDLSRAKVEILHLKAEVERLTKAHSDALADFWAIHKGYFDLKAENERLTEIIRREVDGGVDLRDEAQRTVEENHKLRAEVERLRASSFVTAVPVEQYERLRRAGDAMASCIQFNEEMEKDYEGPTHVRKCVKDWNSAKDEGDTK